MSKTILDYEGNKTDRRKVKWSPEDPFIDPTGLRVQQIIKIRRQVEAAFKAGRTPIAFERPSNVSPLAWRFWRSCLRKKHYRTERSALSAEAFDNTRAYECEFCKSWHRTKKGCAIEQFRFRASGDHCEKIKDEIVIERWSEPKQVTHDHENEHLSDDEGNASTQWDAAEDTFS